ncbi:MAG: DUF3667 domain-containing protein [Verrucomicrobiota bacterium]|nr:DUF3667 domain-containing protein [Verrucomicrobiota bacterium]
MSDDSTHLILGDAAAAASEEIGGPRRFFRRKKKSPRPPLTNCENCEAPLSGPYCAKCGQHAVDYHRSVLHILADAADSFFDWDAKIFRTIGVLLVKPWKLTNVFNAGRRAHYVHPLRIYLLASITFFLIAKLMNFSPSSSMDLTPEDRAELDVNLGKLTAPNSHLTPDQRVKIETVRTRFLHPETSLTPAERERIDRAAVNLPGFIRKRELKAKENAKLDAILDSVVAPSPAPAPTQTGTPADGIPAPPVAPISSAHPQVNPIIQFDSEGEQKSPFGAWLEERLKKKVGDDGTKVQLFLETLRSNVPTMMLCCIPIFAFILKILYLRQRRFYIAHLVYALHIHSFVYLAVVVIVLLAMGANRTVPALSGWLIGLLVFATCLLVFSSIRRVYKQGWFMSILKFLLGGLAYLIVLSLGIGATAFITLLLPD